MSLAFAFLVVVAGLLPAILPAQEAAPEKEAVLIGHISLSDDPRYLQDWGYARLVVPPPVRSIEGAMLALEDMAFVSDAAGIAPVVDAREAANAAEVATAVMELSGAGAAFVVLDLPGDMVAAVAEATADLPITLINATAPEDALRAACYPNMLHSGPSDRMQMDTFAQYLRAMGWEEVLVLVGEDPRDTVMAEVLQASLDRLRLEVVEARPFTLATDPESREGNNVRLLTGGVDYDVVFVADTRGEFGRYVPYATQLPRPVMGSVGLTVQAWHWAMERDGATQVSSRFDRQHGRRMTTQDWAAWIAVKGIIIAYTRAPDRTRESLTGFMRSEAMRLDGSKGVTLNYRTWDGQLRMPMLLASSEAVIAIAPVEGFLHATNTLDTLGVDEAEFVCN